MRSYWCLSPLAFVFASAAPPPAPDATVVRAHVVVKSVRLADNGDNDGSADPNETVSLYLTLRNGSGVDRSGVVVTVASTDPTVDCIPTPVVAFGALLAGEEREAAVPAVFRVADVARSDPFGSLSATFDVQIAGDDFGGTTRAQQVVLDLDVNVSGGLIPSTFTEGFEGGGFGTFTSMTLDVDMASNALSDGHRCQYNDPDFPGSNSFGNTFCYLGGSAVPGSNAFDWHLHGAASPDGGRAYLGSQSLHWGIHPGLASADTTRLRQLDAIRTTNPVNLGWNGVTPQLSFKHQAGMTDSDYISGLARQAVDRGVVQVQLASSAGAGVGSWRKIFPYQNLYDSQGHDLYANCSFDPVDDGSTEDDYFDPTDPERSLGPSSTCQPEFVFSRVGAIFWSDTFDPQDIHHASDGPGLQGTLGPGTWVESKFDLSRYRGRRVRLRFLTTSLEVGSAVTMQQALGWNPTEADDGWYLDDVRVTNTLVSAATVAVDPADRSGLPACGPVCGSVTASLVPTPASVGPDEEVTLDASGSAPDQCPGGALHYRFWIDRDNIGTLDHEPYIDRIVQEWGPNAIVTHVSNTTARYVVDVRCSTRPACAATTSIQVPFACPSIEPVSFPESIGFVDKTQVSWQLAGDIDAIRGSLDALRASGGQFDGTVDDCLRQGAWDFFVDPDVPSPGGAFYYLVKPGDAPALCTFPSWGTGSPAERPGAGGDRDEDIPADPDTCG